MRNIAIITTLFLLFSVTVGKGNDRFLNFIKITAKSGDGVYKLLNRYNLSINDCNLNAFKVLNQLPNEAKLYANNEYLLPIQLYAYNGKSIRSTINDNDYQKALRIQSYNNWLFEKGIVSQVYTSSKKLWVPIEELGCQIEPTAESIGNAVGSKVEKNYISDPLLGKNHEKVLIESSALAGKVIYLFPGHGGPDPGALGKYNSSTLCEDEYAYDVTLRLYRKLKANGAEVYLIIQDKNDGIQDGMIIPCDHDETDLMGEPIPLNQKKRLKQRVDHANRLYLENKPKKQLCVAIHVDSRSHKQKQDVFFCYLPGSSKGKHFAASIKNTFKEKYRIYQKNRSYHGTLEGRNLYVLKHTFMPSVFIELGNIQSSFDHQRLLKPENREAMAKWIFEGIQDGF